MLVNISWQISMMSFDSVNQTLIKLYEETIRLLIESLDKEDHPIPEGVDRRLVDANNLLSFSARTELKWAALLASMDLDEEGSSSGSSAEDSDSDSGEEPVFNRSIPSHVPPLAKQVAGHGSRTGLPQAASRLAPTLSVIHEESGSTRPRSVIRSVNGKEYYSSH
jgi:hypothetical protein